jgi:hypothetical protein
VRYWDKMTPERLPEKSEVSASAKKQILCKIEHS